MAILNAPIVTPGNINTVLGVNSTDVGRLCTASTINPWAKYKPVRNSTPGVLALSQRPGVNYGLSLDTFRNGIRDVEQDGGNYLHYAEKHWQGGTSPGIVDEQWVKYLPPRGKASDTSRQDEWYRLLDFNGYNSDEQLLPLRLLQEYSVNSYFDKDHGLNYSIAFFDENTISTASGSLLNYNELNYYNEMGHYYPVSTTQHVPTSGSLEDMWLGMALFQKVDEITTYDLWECIDIVPARRYVSGSSSTYCTMLKDMNTVGDDEREYYPELFPAATVGKKYFRYNIDPSLITNSELVDVNNSPRKSFKFYLRPVLYEYEPDHPGTAGDQGEITWNSSTPPGADRHFYPLRTPGTAVINDAGVTLGSQIYIYCRVTYDYDLDTSGLSYTNRYAVDLRMANCWDDDYRVTMYIDDLRVRLYDSEEWMNKDTGGPEERPEGWEGHINEDLTEITDQEAQAGGWISPQVPMWTLNRRYGTGTDWRNNFSWYQTNKNYIEFPSTQQGLGKYPYFKIKMSYRIPGGLTSDITYQYGLRNSHLVENLKPLPS